MSEEDKKDNVFPMEDFVKPTKPSDHMTLQGGIMGLAVTPPKKENKEEPKP